MSAQTDKERVIAEMVTQWYDNTESEDWLARSGYDAGYAAALERAAQHFTDTFREDADLELGTVVSEIRALKEKAAGTVS